MHHLVCEINFRFDFGIRTLRSTHTAQSASDRQTSQSVGVGVVSDGDVLEKSGRRRRCGGWTQRP